ncbi:uncharacterized protein LOC125878876 isoform X2 [Epinephelus fuscoguttatus]|uniref:uncharacterized protein LOC125878876 isoform X2 n=1 Tax=Epinephelus fuscoguttatus TaxID=293821 RepID=UPI0020D1A15B|nr:uncharacterized protein LOC125878876 isoform X2 [Epinephelus fuscoguttatus]
MMAEVAVSRWMRRRGGRRRRPAAAALYDDVTVGATGEEFELQVAMFEEVLCVAVLFTDVDPIIRSLFRRFTRPSSLLGSSNLTNGAGERSGQRPIGYQEEGLKGSREEQQGGEKQKDSR